LFFHQLDKIMVFIYALPSQMQNTPRKAGQQRPWIPGCMPLFKNQRSATAQQFQAAKAGKPDCSDLMVSKGPELLKTDGWIFFADAPGLRGHPLHDNNL